VLANTEITNFAASESADVALPQALQWHTAEWTVVPAPLHTPLDAVCPITTGGAHHACVHELWLDLDLAHPNYAHYTSFTLRLSWPAYTPTDFRLEILDPPAVAALLRLPPSTGAQTRRKYARIRAVDTGVLTPPAAPRALNVTVAFVLTLEPLYLGVLPATLVPFLL
ncbi:hypothetical protein B0H10DRAFT_1718127, partial [Mycena sp. CBHHK59/15]